MKRFLIGLCFIASPAIASQHPFLIVSSNSYTAMRSSATAHPWSDINAQAVADLASPIWGTYNGLYGTTGEPVQNQINAMIQLFGINSLLYILDPASSSTYKSNMVVLIDTFPSLSNREIAIDPSGYARNSPLNGAFFSMVLAFDVIYNDLTPTQQSSYTLMMDKYIAADRLAPSSWNLANDGAHATWEVFRGTGPFQIIKDTITYHYDIFPSTHAAAELAYLGGPTYASLILGNGTPADFNRSAEQTTSQLNHEGGQPSGALYANARLAGDSIEKMAKWGTKYVMDYTGADRILNEPIWKTAMEWLYAAGKNPFNYYVVIGDTNNQYPAFYGNGYWSSRFTLNTMDLTVGRHSTKAAGWASRFANLALTNGATVYYPNDLLNYVTAPGSLVAPSPSVSYVLPYTGAAFWDDDQSTNALFAVLSNPHLTRFDHFHSDQGTLYMAAYGEQVLSNVGYAGGSGGAQGFSREYILHGTKGNNVVLMGNNEFTDKQVTSSGYLPASGGDGISESLLSNHFDYASAISTSPYTYIDRVSGSPLGSLGALERNVLFIHPSDGQNGYFAVEDEIVTTTVTAANILWHPYSRTLTTTTLNTEYAWPISQMKTSTTTLNIFLATPPSSIAISSSVFAGGEDRVGEYINAQYNVDASSSVRAVTVLYPSDATHSKSTFTRVQNGAQVTSGPYDDFIIPSSGTVLTSTGTTFTGKLAFIRKRGGTMTQYFVRKGTAFTDGAGTGFTSGAPVSLHMLASSGTITSTGTTVSFYKPNIAGVWIDGALVSSSSVGGTSFNATVSSGSHTVSLSTAAAAAGPTINITGVWATDGGYKLAQEDLYPDNASTMTITRNWDGTTVKTFGAKNETVGFGLYLLNSSTTNASGVNVSISSFTGPPGYGISSVVVSSANVMDFSGRPIEQFYLRYLRVDGLTQNYWDPSEYEERSVPPRMRRPFTVGGSGQGTPSGLWTDRPDHDKLYPDIMIPYEAVKPSSFTVYSSSSQAIWWDVFVSSLQAPGTYYATITVTEGSNVSASIPVQLLVYNFKLPDQPAYKTITFFSGYDINYRHENDHFPSPGTAVQKTRDSYAQFLHRHKITSIGDSLSNCCSTCGLNKPCPEYEQRLNGVLYTATSGYYNAPGVGTGDPIYAIGSYQSWPSASWSSTQVTNGTTGFCDKVSGFRNWFNTNSPQTKSFLYLADEPSDFTLVNKWSTWMSTVTACLSSAYTVNSAVTISLASASVSVPHLNLPISTNFMQTSQANYETLNTQYQTTGTTQAWRYNGSPPGSAAAYALEEDGIGPLTIAMADFKKNIPTHFYWESTYFTDTNESGRNNDLFNNPLTFGYVNQYASFTVSGMSTNPTCDYTTNGNQYEFSYALGYTGTAPNIQGYLIMLDTVSALSVTPTPSVGAGTLTKVAGTCHGAVCTCTGDATVSFSSWVLTNVHPVKGQTGYHHSNLDGLLMYPGTDGTYPANSYGWDGPIASWRLKMIRKGINLSEYATMAEAVAPSTVTNIVNGLMPKAYWENPCFLSTDCTYGYGDRSWSNDPNVWETAREQLATLAVSSSVSVVTISSSSSGWQLNVDGLPYLVKGVSYAADKVGEDPNVATLRDSLIVDDNSNGRADGPYDAWVDADNDNVQDVGETAYGDFALMRDMNVNTIRLYHHSSDSATLTACYPAATNPEGDLFLNHAFPVALMRDLYATYGIRVAMGDELGAYTNGSCAPWVPGTDYSNSVQIASMTASVREMVLAYKNEPWLLMYVLGNENNYDFTHTNASSTPTAYYTFVGQMVDMIHSLDPNHPVALANGETMFISTAAALAPNLDIFGLNAYRNPGALTGFGTMWSDIKALWDKPVLLTEFGLTNPQFSGGLFNDAYQSTILKDYWCDIRNNSAGYGIKNSIGGFNYNWLDSWWQNGVPLSSSSLTTDNNEMTGIWSQGSGANSPYERQERAAYDMYTAAFAPGSTSCDAAIPPASAGIKTRLRGNLKLRGALRLK